MSDIRDELAHVLWIGGGPRVGKTTLARLLAGKWDLKVYNLDWHQVREHRERRVDESREWDDLSPDERWVIPSSAELAERDAASWTRGFPLVLDDLRSLPRIRTVLAEGPGAFPWCVAPLIRVPTQAIFLLPSGEFRDAVLARRVRDVAPERRIDGQTGDPERARRNLRERDLLLIEQIRSSCDSLGLRWVQIDGSLDLDDSLALIESHFGPHLPRDPNV